MAVITCHLNPWGLGMRTSFDLILPEPVSGPQSSATPSTPDRKYPVLWLLHGGGSNRREWLLGTDILELSTRYGIAVVMPDAQISSYVDMVYGPKWFTYLTQSLPQFVYEHFPVSDDRGDNFIAGASMGGYGALKFALSCPMHYAAAAVMGSGVRLPQNFAAGKISNDSDNFLDKSLAASFGEDRQGVLDGPNDCYALARRAKEDGVDLPKLLSCCGKKDFTYAENVDFRDYMRSLGFPMEWVESGEGHTVQAWNEFLSVIMKWLPVKGKVS
jgi:putative tributyrin esterase